MSNFKDLEFDFEDLLNLLHEYGVDAVRVGKYEIELTAVGSSDDTDFIDECEFEFSDTSGSEPNN